MLGAGCLIVAIGGGGCYLCAAANVDGEESLRFCRRCSSLKRGIGMEVDKRTVLKML